MGVTALGATPQNQLDALPILTVSDIASPGELTILGGTINRSFTAAQVGIADAQRVGIGGGQTAVGPGNYLDLTGCNKFMFALRRRVLAATEDTTDTPQLRAQRRMFGGDMTTTNTLIVWQPVVGIFANMNVLGGPYPQDLLAISGWTNDSNLPAAGGGNVNLVGANIRFFLQFSNGPINPANQLWSLEVYAQT